MARRDYPLMFRCAHPGCQESVTYRYPTRRDLIDSYEQKWYSGGRWKCIRHSQPDEVLSASNPETRYECISREEPHGRYWGHSGFVSGPGFKAFPKDFPPGTKLIVTATIVLPESDRAALSRQPSAPASAGELSDDQCIAVYQALDEFGRNVDHYEYGVPMLGVDDRQTEALQTIRTAIEDARAQRAAALGEDHE